MSRNPNKAPCQVPGCRNWAMRGHTHCRPHRDPELGPRGAGAPPRNLNALRTGDHAHALSPTDLRELAHRIQSQPDQLPQYLSETVHSTHARCQDPVKTLVALKSLVPDLLNLVADATFIVELHDLIERRPPANRSRFEIDLWHHALRLGPVAKLTLVRLLAHRLDAQPGPPDHQ